MRVQSPQSSPVQPIHLRPALCALFVCPRFNVPPRCNVRKKAGRCGSNQAFLAGVAWVGRWMELKFFINFFLHFMQTNPTDDATGL